MNRPAATIVSETVSGYQRRKYYKVQCVCGRVCKFWRWSWLSRGAEPCRGCEGLVLAPTASPMLALLVVHRAEIVQFWKFMSPDEQAAAIRQLVRDLADGDLVAVLP